MLNFRTLSDDGQPMCLARCVSGEEFKQLKWRHLAAEKQGKFKVDVVTGPGSIFSDNLRCDHDGHKIDATAADPLALGAFNASIERDVSVLA